MNYIVKRGDTLSKIASRYSTTVRALAAANGIQNVNRISIGQRLTISNPAQQTQSFRNQNPLELTGGEVMVKQGGAVGLPQSAGYSYDDNSANGASTMLNPNAPYNMPQTDYMPYILIGGGLLVLFMVIGKSPRGVTRYKRRK